MPTTDTRISTPHAQQVRDYFVHLGDVVRVAWRAAGHDDHALPGIAAAALRDTPPHTAVDALAVLRWAALSDDLPAQARLDQNFGRPPITVFSSGRFRIDILFWDLATTGIHCHAFAGAFTLLDGSSVHARYTFELEQRVNAHFLLGQVRLAEVEVLVPGDVRVIAPGYGLMHTLYHLDMPTATVVIRTHRSSESGPEYEYLAPHVAFDPSFDDAATQKRIQILDLMLRTEHAEYEALATEVLRGFDLHTGFLVLRRAQHHRGPGELVQRLVEVARDVHGNVVDRLEAVLTEEWRRDLLVSRRKSVWERELRMFMALLQHLRSRQAIIDAIRRARSGSEPLDLVERWVHALAQRNLLGMELDDVHALIFGLLLRGADEAAVRARLEERFTADEVAREWPRIRAACELLRRSPILGVLLR
jgi:hypothetical protein